MDMRTRSNEIVSRLESRGVRGLLERFCKFGSLSCNRIVKGDSNDCGTWPRVVILVFSIIAVS